MQGKGTIHIDITTLAIKLIFSLMSVPDFDGILAVASCFLNIAHMWKSTKLWMGCVCMCVFGHTCVQIAQQGSFLLVSLYSFWCLLWQISVRRDFVCWFISEASCMTFIYWMFLSDLLFVTFERESFVEEWNYMSESSLALKIHLKYHKL